MSLPPKVSTIFANGAYQLSPRLCLVTDCGVAMVVPGYISPVKLSPPHTKRPHVPLVLPMCVGPVEVEKAHTAHPVETGTTTARKRVVLQENSGHNLLVLAEVRRGNRAGSNERDYGVGIHHVLQKSMPIAIRWPMLCLPSLKIILYL